MKAEKRTVDDRLPKWLHSKILSAVDFIWEGRQESMEESVKRVRAVNEYLTEEEMNWVLMLLVLPKLKDIIKTSDDWKNFQADKEAKESVH